MKIPQARQLSSGAWFIQLRLGGQSVTVSNANKRKCEKEAEAIKANYNLTKKLDIKDAASPTLTAAIDLYIKAKENTLSPLTIRGYRIIQKHRFQSTMERPLNKISSDEWQLIVNAETALCSYKTLKNAWGLIRSVVRYTTGTHLPDITLPTPIAKEKAFLQPEEILPFVAAVKNTHYAVPLLLALSSLRISEIQALRWENIPRNPEFIRVQGSVVLNEDNKWIRKAENKNASSARNVPILIPELAAALERERRPSGPVLTISQNALRCALHKICKENNLTDVTVHGLRHSFASLGYHLRIPEEIIMEIGGWNDRTTMLKIYTHIARSDISRYKNALSAFYSSDSEKNAN